MRVTRPITRAWGHRHPVVLATPGGRPLPGGTVGITHAMTFTDAGPSYKGMDPTDPATWVRMWNPAPGMIARLNYDGAAFQGRTPTQVQRGSQRRGRRGTS